MCATFSTMQWCIDISAREMIGRRTVLLQMLRIQRWNVAELHGARTMPKAIKLCSLTLVYNWIEYAQREILVDKIVGYTTVKVQYNRPIIIERKYTDVYLIFFSMN